MKQIKVPLEKVSFYPKRRFSIRDIKKEKHELLKKFKVSRFSLFMVCVLLSTGVVYYSAFMLDFLGLKTKTVVIMLAPFWVAISILMYALLTGKKVKNILTGRLNIRSRPR